MNRILVAIDGSPPASDALDAAIDLARDSGARLTALCVQVMLVRGGGATAHSVVVTAPNEPRPTTVLADAARRARAAGVDLATLAHAGDPREQIVATADELDVDVIVIGSRGVGEIRSALLGSVSRSVVARSRRPVMIVRQVPVREPILA